jgi:thiol-disulfide isomerase/thioredoxin
MMRADLHPDSSFVADDLITIQCGPCVRIAPMFETWSKEFPNVSFLKVG